MKRISLLVLALALCGAPASRAQDAATEERLNKLSGRIDDLAAGQEALRKQIDSLMRDISSLRDQASKPSAASATPEDLNRVAEAVKEVDRKRLEDYDKIRTELLTLRKVLSSTAPPPSHTRPPVATPDDKPVVSDKGFEYEVQKGDSLSLIVQAYREKNIKVTTDQILKANPGLKPEKLRVGQKIWIPAPPQS